MLTQNIWKELPFPGVSCRTLHTTTLFKHYIINIGGYSAQKESEAEETLEVFNLEKGELEKFNLQGDELKPVKQHSACLFDSNKILVFGGFSTGNKSINDVVIITIEETPTGLTLNCKNIPTTCGEDYRALSHTANIYKNKMYVFGGRSEKKIFINELWRLDLESFHWERCETTGNIPLARALHYSAIYDDKLYIFGGLLGTKSGIAKDCHILSLKNLHWEELKTRNLSQLCRFGTSTAIIGDEIFIIGGTKENETTEKDHVISYNFKNNTIKNVSSKGKYPAKLLLRSAVVFKNQIIMWGEESNIPLTKLSALRIDNVYQGEESSLPISSLLNSEQYSDIRLSIEGSVIPAHKFVLGMKCKYFNDMFSSGMKESQVQVLEIPDVKLEIFKAFLKFLYQNYVEFTEDLAKDLYVLSDKYMQKDLADLCEDFLAFNLHLDNVMEMVDFAEMYGAELLKKAVSEFAENHLEELPDLDLSRFLSKDSETSQIISEKDKK